MTKYQFHDLIDRYLESKALAWSPTTLKSERSRLRMLPPSLISEPAKLYTHLLEKCGRKPYTIKTTFVRLSDFSDWLLAHGHTDRPNTVRSFLQTHSRLFKHAYKAERLEVTYEEAQVKLNSIGCREVREKAQQLLAGGLRFRESSTICKGQVIGKGGKPRDVFLPAELEHPIDCSYSQLYRALKKLGLKPHGLRKLAATRWAEAGARTDEILLLGGWESMETVTKYVQPRKKEELKKLVNASRG